MKQHSVPSNASRRLDLHIAPDEKTAAAGYGQLLALLEDLGRRLDEGTVTRDALRQWEQQVVGNLHDREIDQLMRVSDEGAFDAATLPEQRWRNLRSILLARKGLSPRIC
ncbi:MULTISPECIES: hypothetical protein [Chelativorans]|jgi:hypothetical protein|nr:MULTISPECIES: hypothetical protein [Chelativorans]